MAKKKELLTTLLDIFFQDETQKKEFIDKFNSAKDEDEIDETEILQGAKKYSEPLIDLTDKIDGGIKKWQGQHFAQFRNEFKKFGIDITERDIEGKTPQEMAQMAYERLKSKVGTGDAKQLQDMLDLANANLTKKEEEINAILEKHKAELAEANTASERKEIMNKINNAARKYIKDNNLAGASEDAMLRSANAILSKYNYKEENEKIIPLDKTTNTALKHKKGTMLAELKDVFDEAFEGFEKRKQNDPPKVEGDVGGNKGADTKNEEINSLISAIAGNIKK